MDAKPRKLLDQVRDSSRARLRDSSRARLRDSSRARLRDRIRLKHYSYRTEQTYVYWIRRYILFHHKRHSAEVGIAELEAFLKPLSRISSQFHHDR